MNRTVAAIGSTLLVTAVTLADRPRASQVPAAAPPPAQTPASRRSQRVAMQPVTVASPDGRLTLSLLPNAERLTFVVKRLDQIVIEPSPIVMDLDGYDLSAGVVMHGSAPETGNETYRWRGAHSTATNHFNGARVSLTHDLSSTDYTLEIRVFDDGVAFRHVIPGSASPRVPDERTTFVLPANATVWYAGMDGHYEAPYVKKRATDIEPGEWAGPPVTFALPGNAAYASITEANLVDYSGMGLEADGRRGWTIGLGHRQPLNYPFELRYGRAEGKRLGQPAAITGTITTPWRVVLAGADLNTLVNSTILANLSPAPDPKLFSQGIDTPWLEPGRAVWRYLDGGPTGVEGMKTFSRMAGELGFEYHILEGFWTGWTMDQRREVVADARSRGVGLWFWRHSNQLRTPDARDEFFRMLRDLGVVGAKIDFFDHEAKEVVDLYEALLRKAAEYHILLDFHGANKPTGRERTWPNELTREAVRGMESSGLMNRAEHQTTLPFTRMLAGPAEYTTMLFTERRRDSSIAHQIASLAVFSSPLLTIAANPQSILDSPAVDVIKSIPPVWDETIVLPPSAIGELVAFARRSGNTWFLAVMSGPAPRELVVPLAFLGDGEYQSTMVNDDGSDGSGVRVTRGTASKTGVSRITLRAGGGYVARFVK